MTALQRIRQEVDNYHPFLKLLILLVGAGAAAGIARFIFGLGATTNLSDTYPWGLWISFDVVTSVPLAAGAFVLGAIIHCFHIKKLEPLIRPAIVTGFLGYSLVCIGLLLDLGQPQRGWHVFAYPNLHSPMFEVALCVMSYTTVALLEFLSRCAKSSAFMFRCACCAPSRCRLSCSGHPLPPCISRPSAPFSSSPWTSCITSGTARYCRFCSGFQRSSPACA